MKKTIKYIVLAALCHFFSAGSVHSQNFTVALKVGDKVPDVTINNVINHPGGSLTSDGNLASSGANFLSSFPWLANGPFINDLRALR